MMKNYLDRKLLCTICVLVLMNPLLLVLICYLPIYKPVFETNNPLLTKQWGSAFSNKIYIDAKLNIILMIGVYIREVLFILIGNFTIASIVQYIIFPPSLIWELKKVTSKQIRFVSFAIKNKYKKLIEPKRDLGGMKDEEIRKIFWRLYLQRPKNFKQLIIEQLPILKLNHIDDAKKFFGFIARDWNITEQMVQKLLINKYKLLFNIAVILAY